MTYIRPTVMPRNADEAHAMIRARLDSVRLSRERIATDMESNSDTPGCAWDVMRRVDALLTEAATAADAMERFAPLALSRTIWLTGQASRGLDAITTTLNHWRTAP